MDALDADLKDIEQSLPERKGDCLTVPQIEQWLDKSLQVCIEEKLSAAAGLKTFQNSKPMYVFEIDRMTLNNFGIPSNQVDRIYRSLYVNTVGFYDTIKQSTAVVTSQRHTAQSKIWKAYQALLEYCCATDFKQISGKLVEEKNEIIKAVIQEYTDKQEAYLKKTRSTIESLQEKERHYNTLQREKETAEYGRMRAERLIE